MASETQKIRIGRDAACDLVIADKSVSRRHADLLIDADGNLEIVDLESSGGTYLVRGGKEETVTRAALKPADVVVLGEYTLTVHELLERVRHISTKTPPVKEATVKVQAKKSPPPLPALPKASAPKAGGRMVRCECGTIKKRGETCPSCGA